MASLQERAEESPQPFHVIKGGLVLEFLPEPEGGYTVTVPALPGCVSYGQTFEKAIAMVRDAIQGWVAVAQEEGIPIPDAAWRASS